MWREEGEFVEDFGGKAKKSEGFDEIGGN